MQRFVKMSLWLLVHTTGSQWLWDSVESLNNKFPICELREQFVRKAYCDAAAVLRVYVIRRRPSLNMVQGLIILGFDLLNPIGLIICSLIINNNINQ